MEVKKQLICFILSTLGVKFRYEEPYEHQLADGMHSQYRPDFSIYFMIYEISLLRSSCVSIGSKSDLPNFLLKNVTII